MYCQKCRTPLKLDSSLEDLNPAAYDLLVAASSQQPPKTTPSSRPSQPSHPQEQSRRSLYDKISQNAGAATFKRHAGAARDSAMSFIFLTESQVQPQATPRDREAAAATTTGKNPASDGRARRGSSALDGPVEAADREVRDMERINKLFEILSARSDIDHPICVECTELLVDGLQKKLESASRERDAFVGYLKDIQASRPSADDVRAQEAALRKAERDEAAALADLRRLEADKAAADAQVAALEAESRAVDAAEEAFWRERNAFAARLASFQAERDSVNSRFDHDARALEKLQRSNVYNDTFCISHDGTFATINGLRLGRLAARPVDWPEINAAWGHALLLVVTVAERLGHRFDGYEPLPMGSTSRIARLDLPSPSSSRAAPAASGRPAPPPNPRRVELELFSSGDMPLGLTFMHRKFDTAMVAFLELVRQLGGRVRDQTAAGGRALALPYRIEGDRIGDVSIKLGIAQDDGWTKACKYTLTCCKFLLAHASNVSAPARDGS